MRKFVKYTALIFIGLYLISVENIKAQPLDPSLPGYEEVQHPERPGLKIVSPKDGSDVLGPRVTLKYLLSGIDTIDPALRKLDIRGEGHLKITFTSAENGFAPAQIYVGNSPIVFEQIPEGRYTLSLEAVKNSGRSFDPPVKDSVRFKVSHPLTPTSTLTPTPTVAPIPLTKQLTSRQPFSLRELLLLSGFSLLIVPPLYLFFKGR